MIAYRFRPSKMALTVACSGSVVMQERHPETESGPDAILGTAAHECLAHMLRTGVNHAPGTILNIEGHSVTVDEDMHHNTRMAYEVIAEWGTPVIVERSMSCASIHAQCGGTPDVRAFVIDDGLIRVADYKYGFGIVEVYENWQLLAYLAGYLDELGIHDLDVCVEFTIIQPRATHRDGTVRTWRFAASDVRAHMNIMRNKCAEAEGANARCTPGIHCHAHKCSATAACEALHKSTYNTLAYAQKPESFDLDPQSAARELALLEEAEAIIKARRDGLEVRIMADIAAGVVNPHYVIENATTRRRIKEGMEEAVIGIGEMIGKNLCEPRRALSPAKIEKEVGKANFALFDGCFYKPVGERKLVKFDSSKTRKLFGA